MISIVIPVHNSENYIEETVLSVQRQTISDWELILVNDHSEDKSRNICEALAQKDSRIKVIDSENRGAANARNTGTKAAGGEYLCFLDADDIWLEDKLKKTLDFLKALNAGFVFTGYEFADENARGTGRIVRVPKSLNYDQALGNTTIFTSTVMFDRNKISQELVMMPDIPSEDTATWWQILRSGIIAYGLNEPLTLYRRTQGTLSSDKKEALKRTWNLYRKAEGLSLGKSLLCFALYSFRAVKRRLGLS
ncbi:MAG: glycosyltransferase [Lachnospiraceae bacterium]|nr:glycosyltransferase [Lachnospiraceae bacterium]